MRKTTLAAGMLCAVLVGCDLPPPIHVMAVAPTTYHDVIYYDAHLIERGQALAWCRNNPGLQEKAPSCESAATSARNEWNHKMGYR